MACTIAIFALALIEVVMLTSTLVIWFQGRDAYGNDGGAWNHK